MATDILVELRDADSYNAAHYARDPLHAKAFDEIGRLRKDLADAEKEADEQNQSRCELIVANAELKAALARVEQVARCRIICDTATPSARHDVLNCILAALPHP